MKLEVITLKKPDHCLHNIDRLHAHLNKWSFGLTVEENNTSCLSLILKSLLIYKSLKAVVHIAKYVRIATEFERKNMQIYSLI